MSQAILELAESRERLVKATELSQQAHAAQSALLVRKTEAEALAATALSDFRAGKIDEATASLRRASAEADAKDLTVLVGQGAAALLKINQGLDVAQSRAAQAEHAAKREEHELLAAALDKQIAELEQTFLAAHAERGRVYKALNPRSATSTFTYYKASQALDELVRRNQPPII